MANMNERILQLIDFTGLSAIQFADKVGLNRSSLYHIKNGRSAPSLDIVVKILSVFPQISTDWMLHGKGEMMRPDDIQFQNSDLFTDSISNNECKSINEPISIVINDTIVESNSQTDTIVTNSAQISESNSIVERTPVKMIIYYSDNSFEVFSLGKSTLL